MKFQGISIIIISFFICLSVSNAREMEGENLIQKFPIPSIGGPWKVYQKVDEGGKQAMWRNKGGYEILQTLVVYQDGGSSIKGIKIAGENDYKKSCSEFSSNTINESIENGYKSITWKITCKTKANFTSTILHKGITGNDAVYVIQKI